MSRQRTDSAKPRRRRAPETVQVGGSVLAALGPGKSRMADDRSWSEDWARRRGPGGSPSGFRSGEAGAAVPTRALAGQQLSLYARAQFEPVGPWSSRPSAGEHGEDAAPLENIVRTEPV
jgi:hypothetical protein